MDDTGQARERMVQGQVAARGVAAPPVLAAMHRVPRDLFVTDELAEFAHSDTALPIAHGQTISQPYVVAAMAEAARILPPDRVLEVGTGSGYAAAILAELAAEVYTIERHATLAADARERLERLGYRNVRVRHGDGTLGCLEAAPVDAIAVTAGGPMPDTFPFGL